MERVQRSWRELIFQKKCCSRDPGLVSDEITKIDKGKNRIKIITTLVLSGRWGIYVCWKISSSDSRWLKRDTRKKRII